MDGNIRGKYPVIVVKWMVTQGENIPLAVEKHVVDVVVRPLFAK